MKIRVLPGFLLLISLVLSAPSAASDSAADPNKLLALENAWNDAQVRRDAKALDGLVASTFVYTDYDGTVMNKAQFLADVQDTSYRASLVVNENVKVIPYQGAAIVIGTYHTKGTYKGKTYEHWGRFTDTWVFENSIWQCVASHTNLIAKPR